MNKTTRIAILRVNGGPIEITAIENTGQGYHDVIGNWIEVFQLPNPLKNRGLIGICDEEGWLKSNPQTNIYSPLLGQPIAGHVIITKDGKYGDFVDLSEDDINTIADYFGLVFRIVYP